MAEGLAAKRERFRDPGGRPPFGFRRNSDKLVEPDPELLPRVQHIFDLAASGLTDREVAAAVDLPLFTVRGMLSSPLYIGRLRDGGAANWPALIDLSTWERAQAVRARRATNTGRPADPRRPYALSMLHCAACGARLIGDTGYYRHRQPCEAFIEAKPAKRRGLGTGYRQEWYEGLVEQLLERVTLDAPTIAQVVEAVADPVEDRLVLARVERERDEALRRYRTDRDGEALTVAMARLDAEEAKARRPLPSSMSASEVVGYLRDLPTLWADAPASRVRIAESLFERIDVLGFQRASIHLSGDAIGRGLAAALPVSCSLSVYGRGERI